MCLSVIVGPTLNPFRQHVQEQILLDGITLRFSIIKFEATERIPVHDVLGVNRSVDIYSCCGDQNLKHRTNF